MDWSRHLASTERMAAVCMVASTYLNHLQRKSLAEAVQGQIILI